MSNDQIIKDYAIWQAITDLESRCRHRPTGLQMDIEDKAHNITVEYALFVLEKCGVEMVRDQHYGNLKIIYDRGQNQFFGKS